MMSWAADFVRNTVQHASMMALAGVRPKWVVGHHVIHTIPGRLVVRAALEAVVAAIVFDHARPFYSVAFKYKRHFTTTRSPPPCRKPSPCTINPRLALAIRVQAGLIAQGEISTSSRWTAARSLKIHPGSPHANTRGTSKSVVLTSRLLFYRSRISKTLLYY